VVLPGAAKPISIGAFGFRVFTITALAGCTFTSLYLICRAGFKQNSYDFFGRPAKLDRPSYFGRFEIFSSVTSFGSSWDDGEMIAEGARIQAARPRCFSQRVEDNAFHL